MTAVYALYVSTFDSARAALAEGDDLRLRALCAEAASRDGIEGTVSFLAMSDAGQGGPRRRRAPMLWLIRHSVEPSAESYREAIRARSPETESH